MNEKSALMHALKQADARNRALSESFEILANRTKNVRNRLEGGYIDEDDYSSIVDVGESLDADAIAFDDLLAEFNEVAKLINFIKAELTRLEGGK